VVDVVPLLRDAVELGHAHATQQFAERGPGVHAELALGDDLQTVLRGGDGAIGEVLEPVGDEVDLLGQYREVYATPA